MKTQLPGRALKSFRARMLAWFRTHQRDLPWRLSRNPYRIWVAEVMLQQTRIAAVMPYYQRFLARFPTVQSLARAREAEVLKLWSGLGYYSRARNLHRAAKLIVTQHNGKFPRTLDAALELPGIGIYTAAAVLSIAYDVPLAVLDGNVARVLARIKAIRGDLRAPKNWRALTVAVATSPRSASPRRLESIPDGTRRSNLHAAISVLRRMPRRAPLQRLCRRPHRRNPRTTPQTRPSKHENRRRNPPRSARSHPADSRPGRA